MTTPLTVDWRSNGVLDPQFCLNKYQTELRVVEAVSELDGRIEKYCGSSRELLAERSDAKRINGYIASNQFQNMFQYTQFRRVCIFLLSCFHSRAAYTGIDSIFIQVNRSPTQVSRRLNFIIKCPGADRWTRIIAFVRLSVSIIMESSSVLACDVVTE